MKVSLDYTAPKMVTVVVKSENGGSASAPVDTVNLPFSADDLRRIKLTVNFLTEFITKKELNELEKELNNEV